MVESFYIDIGVFSDPFLDEIFYSLCARTFDRLRILDSKSFIEELFASSSTTSIIDLPCHLNRFISVLPYGHCYTVDTLINHHTLLPLYSAFLPAPRVSQIKRDMVEDNGLKAQTRCGGISSSIHAPNWLRFCPSCLEEDKLQYGSPYWHRLHQVTGIEVCPNHQVFLESSSVKARERRIRYEFISAKKAIQPVAPRPLDILNSSHQSLLRIAQDVTWLLNQSNFVPGLESIRDRYIKLLIERGLATYTGQVHIKKLTQALNDYYSPELLKLLQCEIKEGDNNAWFLRLVRSPKHSCHPLYHLLFIQFLGYTVEEFFQLSSALNPFGDGPWPCLNPVCPHFRQLCIQTFELKRDKTHGGRQTATFSCECGFVYSRMGSDTSSHDLFKVGKIKERGKIWEAALEKLWNDPTVTLMEMAKRLGADSQSVKYHAARLNLSYPRPGPTARQIQKTVAPALESKEVESDKLAEYRHEWLEVLQNNPGAGRSELAEQHRRVHSWLSFYDREWLYEHLPPLKSRPPVLSQIDWQQRDIEISIAVRTAAEQLRNKPGKPEKLTKTAIASNSGYLALIQKQLNKLPLTAETLIEVIETTEEFAVRRIYWVAERYCQEGICPKAWQIIRETGIKPYIAEMPQVKEAIANALVFPVPGEKPKLSNCSSQAIALQSSLLQNCQESGSPSGKITPISGARRRIRSNVAVIGSPMI